MSNVTLNTNGWYVGASGTPLTPYNRSGADTIGTAADSGSLNSGRVSTGGGDDVLTFYDLTSSLLANFEVLGSGQPVTLNLGAGNDTLAVYTYNSGSNDVLIDAGTGNDDVTVNLVTILRDGTFEFRMGDGDDHLTLGDWSGNSTTADIVANGGAGNDTFELLGELSDYGFAASGDDLLVTKGSTPIPLTVTGFETFVIEETSYHSVAALLEARYPDGGSGGGGGDPTSPYVDTTGLGGVGTIHDLPITPGTLNAAEHSPVIF